MSLSASKTNKIRLLLVEDDPVWIEGISNLLLREPDMEILLATARREEALRTFMSADVVILDIHLTGNHTDGLQLAAEMQSIQPTKMIMLTAITEPRTMLDAFQAGALHYVDKTNYSQLSSTIRSVMYAGTALALLNEDYARLRAEQMLATLTPAERELLPLLEQGHSTKSIAATLHKSPSTIKNQLSSLLKKLEASTREQALRKLARALHRP